MKPHVMSARNLRRYARNCFATVLFVAIAGSCAGEGCACMEPIEDGFPPEAREANALAVRVSDTGFQYISDNVEMLADQLFPDGLSFDVPPSCNTEPKVCCYVPTGYCGMLFDIDERPGDSPRLELSTTDPNRFELTLRARVRTTVSMPVHQTGPLGGQIACNVAMNTQWSGDPSLRIHAHLDMSDDPVTGTMGIEVVDTFVSGIAGNDVDIFGGLLCSFGDEQDAANQMMANFERLVPSAIEDFLCKKCMTDSDCGSFGSCDGDGVCQVDGTNRCLQSLGTAGRLSAGDLFGALVDARGDTKMDLYLAAGGSTDATTAGLTAGVLTGALPVVGGEPHDCVPIAPEPSGGALAATTALDSNVHPVTGAGFDVGIGIHRQFLDRLGWAAHQGGYLCLNIGPRQVPLLTTESVSIVAPSMLDLAHGKAAPLFLLVRPQRPPTMALGAGTIDASGELVEPLIELSMADLDIDFYMEVDGRFIRLLTLTADLTAGIGLDVDGHGKIIPVLGDLTEALSNLRVTNSELLEEPPLDIAERFPTILGFALGTLGDDLADGFEVPAFGGLTLDIGTGGFAPVDGGDMLGIFGDLAPAAVTEKPVTVQAQIASAAMRRGEPVADVEMRAIGGHAGAAIEWQFRLGSGFWSPFLRADRLTIARGQLALRGVHVLSIRGRVVGEPRTLGDTVELEIEVGAPDDERALPERAVQSGPPATAVVGFHGDSEDEGCGDCSASGTRGGLGAVVMALLALIGFGGLRRSGSVMIAVAMLAALSVACGSDKGNTGDPPDQPSEVVPGPTGRYASMAASGERVVVAAYEAGAGDLVVADVREAGRLAFDTFVDGVPDGPVVFDPNSYRGGIADAGADVGAWTSTAFIGDRVAIAYQDIDRGAVKIAIESGDGYQVHDVETPAGGATLGEYISLAVGADDVPAIAYVSRTHTPPASEEEHGTDTVQLRWARASDKSPSGSSDWSTEVVDELEVDAAAVGSGGGTGLFAAALFVGSAPAIAYYHSGMGALMLSVRGDGGWQSHVIASTEFGDVGYFGDVAIGPSGELLFAYQEGRTDRLWFATATVDGEDVVLSPPQQVDDGRRDGDRPHSVGAGAQLVVDDAGIAIAYQDATDASLLVARRVDGAWTRQTVLDGAVGYGFWVGAAAANGRLWLSTFAYDRSAWPPGHTEIATME